MAASRKSLVLITVTSLIVIATGAFGLAQRELDRLREAFDTDGRIIHRLLSQRAAQHDTVLAMLSLLQPQDAAHTVGKRISSVYPQILDLQQRPEGRQWPDAAMQAAESASRRQQHPVAVANSLREGKVTLVQAGTPSSHALLIDWREAIPWDEWPLKPDSSPVTITLNAGMAHFPLQAGQPAQTPWRFEFRKRLSTESQPFEIVASLPVGWSSLPWLQMLAWALLVALTATGGSAFLQQRASRRRAEELLRLGQVARLNTLGELAAGMAHELNQPLTAILANTQAAQRLLDDPSPDLATARDAMTRSVDQAKRAAAVLSRLRSAVERPQADTALRHVSLGATVNSVLDLLEPECRRLGIHAEVSGDALAVKADPVALEQIIHNLLTNALQALALVAPPERQLHIGWQADGDQATLRISDSGPGIPPEALPRLFEPFYTTRPDGLGLGLSLCESLAGGMHGRLSADNRVPRGAIFTLTLPLAGAP